MTRSVCATRRARLREELDALDLDGIVVTDPLDVRWLTGLVSTAASVLIATVDEPGRSALVTDARYEGAALAVQEDLDVVIDRDWMSVVADWAGGVGISRLGAQEHHLTWADADALAERTGRDLDVTGETLLELRAVKDDAEIAALRRANEITAVAWRETIDRLAVDETEREVARRLERGFVDHGADGVAFRSIVAFGDHSAVPHHLPTDRRLAPGMLVKIDCGALVDGYHADFTRTCAFGAPADELAQIHALVERAQAAGVAAARVGATAGDVDAAARAVIEEAGHGEHFVHGTGHGTGLQIHELPRVEREGSATLRHGTVLTVEPGIYLPGIGGVRIEDSVLVTHDGPVPLADAPRSLLVLDV